MAAKTLQLERNAWQDREADRQRQTDVESQMTTTSDNKCNIDSLNGKKLLRHLDTTNDSAITKSR